MIPKNRMPVHPGIVLSEEFLKPLGISQVELAKRMETPTQRINEIVRGKRGVTPETAWLLSQAFGTSPTFWMNLQMNHDLALNKPKRRVKRFRRPAMRKCV